MRGTSSRWLVGAAFFFLVRASGFFSSALQFMSVFIVTVVLYWGASLKPTSTQLPKQAEMQATRCVIVPMYQ